MARMMDPSELDGEGLENWYRRSPSDVEAEREAARQDRYDAFVRSIGEASASQDDAGGELGADGGEPGLIKARYRPTMTIAPPPMTAPSGLRVGPSLDARGAAPVGAPASGFFGQHDYNSAIGGYFTGLPSPLNIVTSTPSGWWDLGDGTRVRPDEVERIYAEQQRRSAGKDEAAPAPRVRVVDRWRDGQIPQASQVAKGERELDPTCHPNGGWEQDPQFASYSQRTQRYEAQITHAPGLDYVVRNPGQPPVKFDGCAVWEPQHPLLEAKGPGYAALVPYAFRKMSDSARAQADRQARAAPGRAIEWHIAETGAFPFFMDQTAYSRPPITVRETPAR